MMTPNNDTAALIEKLLEGTITASEKEALEHQLEQSPELSEELGELLRVEDLLRAEGKQAQLAAPADFLRAVEDSVASRISSPGTPFAFAGSNVLWIVLAGLVCVTGFVLYPSLRDGFAPEPAPVAQERMAELKPQQPPVLEMPVAREAQPAASPRGTISQEPVAPAVQEKHENGKTLLGAKTDDEEINRTRERHIQVIKDQLAQFRKIGDKTGEAVTLKQLGLMSRQSRRLDESQQYFDQSLQIAQAARLVQLEAEIYGEMGTLALHRNNSELAAQLYRKCIGLLEQSRSNADGWKKKLAEITK